MHYKSHLQKSEWMSSNPTLRSFSGWNEMDGGCMRRDYSPERGQSGEVDRQLRLLQVAHNRCENRPLFVLHSISMKRVAYFSHLQQASVSSTIAP